MNIPKSDHRTRRPVLLVAALLGTPGLLLAEDPATTLPDMTVEGEAAGGVSLYQVDLDQAPATTPILYSQNTN